MLRREKGPAKPRPLSARGVELMDTTAHEEKEEFYPIGGPNKIRIHPD
jgi:hypothetical protein